MKQIPLSQGLFALVDDADFDFLNQWKWCAHKESHTFYAYRATRDEFGKKKVVKMHRVMLGLSDPKSIIDHIDGNGLNNCRTNLRICSVAENNRNQRLSTKNTSGYKGVRFRSDRGKYCARIKINSKNIHIGYFDCPVEAARAYNNAALLYHGEFARLNEL